MSHQHYNHSNCILSATPHKVPHLLRSMCCSYTSENVLGNTAQGVVSTTQKSKFLPLVGTPLAVLLLHPIFNSVAELNGVVIRVDKISSSITLLLISPYIAILTFSWTLPTMLPIINQSKFSIWSDVINDNNIVLYCKKWGGPIHLIGIEETHSNTIVKSPFYSNITIVLMLT